MAFQIKGMNPGMNQKIYRKNTLNPVAQRNLISTGLIEPVPGISPVGKVSQCQFLLNLLIGKLRIISFKMATNVKPPKSMYDK